MSEWRELTWDDAMRRGYEALVGGEALYEEIDAEQGRSNIDIEKHLRRAELKVAQANAWLAMARELAWQRDDYGGRAARSTPQLPTEAADRRGGGDRAAWTPAGWVTTDLVAGLRGSATQRHPPRHPLQDESG